MKHRTQILLDDWQYQALKEEARRLKVSFSSLIRQGIQLILKPTALSKKQKPLKELLSFAGIIQDKKSRLTNKDMDNIIYNKDW